MKSAVEFWLKWMAGMSWQVAVLVVVVGVVAWLARKRSPRFRYALWSLVVLKLCLPPSLSFFTGVRNWIPKKQVEVAAARGAPRPGLRSAPAPRTFPRTEGLSPTVLEEFLAEEENVLIPRTSTVKKKSPPMVASAVGKSREQKDYLTFVLFAIWAAGAIALASLVAVRRRRIKALLRRAKRVESPILGEALRSLGLRRRVEVWACQGEIGSPATFGHVRPRVLLPEKLLSDLPDQELRPILLHELSHIRRNDLWVNFLQTILQAIYWFHPFVWWANARLRHEREMVVDDDVLVRMGEARQSYGEALTHVARSTGRRYRIATALVGVGERPRGLAARLVRIGDPNQKITRRTSLISIVVVLAVAVVAIPQGKSSQGDERQAAKRPAAETKTKAEPSGEVLPERSEGIAESDRAARDEGYEREDVFSAEIPELEEPVDMELVLREMEALRRDIAALWEEMAEVRELLGYLTKR